MATILPENMEHTLEAVPNTCWQGRSPPMSVLIFRFNSILFHGIFPVEDEIDTYPFISACFIFLF